MKYLVEFTIKELLELGGVHCDCGHPPNNHFLDQKDHPCAHCGCKKLRPYVSFGRLVVTDEVRKALVADIVRRFRER
jgi:hypothetical protein